MARGPAACGLLTGQGQGAEVQSIRRANELTHRCHQRIPKILSPKVIKADKTLPNVKPNLSVLMSLLSKISAPFATSALYFKLILETRLNILVASLAPGNGGAPEGKGSVASLISCGMSCSQSSAKLSSE